MAPSTDPEPGGKTIPTKRRRQNPVSCRFCREKKLRCDRQSPCSNCAFRGLLCSNEPKSLPRNGPGPSDASENAAILQRLGRLESIVLNQETHLPSDGNRSQLLPDDAARKSAGPGLFHSTSVASHIQNAPGNHGDADSHETPVSEYADTLKNLEGTNSQRDPWLLTDAVNTQVRVATVHHLALLTSDSAQSDLLIRKHAISCTLPLKEEAILLLDYYRDHLEDFQHVLHFPTVQNHLETYYNDLARGQSVNVSVLVLLLAIFASASLLMSQQPGLEPKLLSVSEGTHLSTYWAGWALEVLKDLNSSSCNMIEDIQSTILLGFVLLSTKGFSTRVHSFFNAVIFRAYDLSLHKTDVGGSSISQNVVDTEIKRRVWWYIVTINWVLSASGGPQEGTYSVHPRQMAVNLPRNIDDKDLIYTNPPIDRPLCEPTTMSYDIQRIKLANLCREAVDLLPISVHDISTVDYQQVIALDQRFDVFLQELPVFLRNDEQSIQQSVQVVARYPQMRIQRQFLSMVLKTKRCKLHQPFLIRGSIDSQYSYSRTVSLKSARALIEEQRYIESLEKDSHPPYPYRLTHRTYHIFMATIVLVMDLCFNKTSSANNSNSNSNNVDVDDEETRVTKTEVMEACRKLYQDQVLPGLCTAYLASLMDVLRKHKVKLRPYSTECIQHNTPSQQNTITRNHHHLPPPLVPSSPANYIPNLHRVTSVPAPLSQPIQQPIFPGPNDNTNTRSAHTDSFNNNTKSYPNNFSFSESEVTASTGLAGSQDFLADFDDLWNDYIELGPNLDMSGWDNLFSDLGSRIA